MSEHTWRVFATLPEFEKESGTPVTVTANDVGSRAAVDNGIAERELERLRPAGIVDRDGDEYRYEGASVELAAARLDTLEELHEDECEALASAVKNDDVDPGEALGDVHDAREAAERALGSEQG